MKTKSELSRLTRLDIKDAKPSKLWPKLGSKIPSKLWPKLGSTKRDKSSIALQQIILPNDGWMTIRDPFLYNIDKRDL